VDVDARDYTDVAIDEVTEALGVHVGARNVSWAVDPEQVDETTVRMHCQFTGVVRETPVEEHVVVPVKISRGTCDRCGRVAGGYYASTVQVRATGRTPSTEERRRAVEIAESHVADREADGDREAFVSEVKETDDGPDVKLSTNGLGEEVARRITRELGGDVESYPTLVTEDADGEEVYRVTYAVRLPPFTPGDVIAPADADGPVLVRSVRGNLKGVRLADGDDYEAPFEGVEADRLATREDAVETVLVAVEDAHAVQVIDPRTSETETVPRPDYLDPDAGTVPVVRTRAGLYVLPQ
jgi:nonsense-mediated mRNA decay protein 3